MSDRRHPFMDWWKQFKPKACSTKLKASTKAEALEEVVKNLLASEQLPTDLGAAALKALTSREEIGTTGIGMGVAIPHVTLPGLDSAACSLSIHADGLDWDAVDGAPVQILFTVLRPSEPGEAHDPERHLAMMNWIAKLAREADFRSFAIRAKTKTELVNRARLPARTLASRDSR